MSINYQDRIPNNVDLGSNRTLQRALEHWQPEFLKRWEELGPKDFQVSDVYLRTATSVDAKGWATYGYVCMPEYRWGIFLNERDPNRRIGFGDSFGNRFAQSVASSVFHAASAVPAIAITIGQSTVVAFVRFAYGNA